MNSPITPRTIVVTGSSSGIGRATALAFARQGDRVLVHGYRNASGAEELTQIINAEASSCSQAKVFFADIGNAEQSCAFAEEAFHWQGRVDAWVNCAGADVITGNARTLSFDEKLERLWRVDVKGTLRLSRMIAAKMLEQPQGLQLPHIVHLSWDQAFHGMEGDSGEYFCTVKAAVAAFSASLAKTLAPRVRVNCIAPGWIRTSWGGAVDGHWSDRAMGESQLQRWGTPEDVANAIVAICDSKNEFINGQTIAVNGGWQCMNITPRCTSSIDGVQMTPQ